MSNTLRTPLARSAVGPMGELNVNAGSSLRQSSYTKIGSGNPMSARGDGYGYGAGSGAMASGYGAGYGAGYGGSWAAGLILFIVLAIIIYFIIWAIRPEFIRKRDSHGSCNDECDCTKALLWAIVIALIITIIIAVIWSCACQKQNPCASGYGSRAPMY